MQQSRRGRGRPLRPPGACLRLRGLDAYCRDARATYRPPEVIWEGALLSEVGLRLSMPGGGPSVLINPRTLAELGPGLRATRRDGELPVAAGLTAGRDRLNIAAAWIEGSARAHIRWPKARGILLLGAELEYFADVVALAHDFANEWRIYPHLDFWAREAAELTGVDVVGTATGIPLPRYKPRDSRTRVAA